MCVCYLEADSLELQEAISKGNFQHDVTNLEPATTYSLYLKAYSPMGASQQSHNVTVTTLGGGKTTKQWDQQGSVFQTGFYHFFSTVSNAFFQLTTVLLPPCSACSTYLLHQGVKFQRRTGPLGTSH